METGSKSRIALFILLFIVLLLIVLPILGNTPLDKNEQNLLAFAKSIKSFDLKHIFTSYNNNITITLYACIVNMLSSLAGEYNNFILRLPSAFIIIILTLSLYRFDGTSKKLNRSFLASLLFLSCGLINIITFHASPIVIPAAFFILSLISLYHGIRHKSPRALVLLILSTTIVSFLLGAFTLIIIGMTAYIFLATSKDATFPSYLSITVSLIISLVISFLLLLLVVGDPFSTERFMVMNIYENIFPSIDNYIYTFTIYIVFAIFPWSLPLIISLFWLAKNPKWIVNKFRALKTLQKFSIVIFIISIPTFFFFSNISFIFIIASIFFNMPLVGSYLLSQLNNHPIVWRITGGICGFIAGIGTAIFIALKSGVAFSLSGYSISIAGHNWDIWCIAIIFFIYSSLYSLWRNKRNLEKNNRYLYNIITLYILSLILYIGYINPDIIIH